MDDDIPEYPTGRIRLQPCQICGRKFNVESLSKHQSICRKVSTKKRRVFDAGKQRATDSDVPYKATKKTAMVYAGQVRPQDERVSRDNGQHKAEGDGRFTKGQNKSNWREKHRQLIRSIREARQVTQAMKQGGPLPAFRPSEVPSDYVTCPYCHRNFNEHSAKRHIPFCQSQYEKKLPPGSRNNQQPLNRGRTLPPQSTQHRQQQYPSSSSGGYSNAGGHDMYNNGYKHSNSAPMIVRRNPSELPPPPSQPLPPPPPTKNGGGGWSLRKLFGFGSKGEAPPPAQYDDYDEDDYQSQGRYPPSKPQVIMRTGRTQENTELNVRARHRSDDFVPQRSRIPPPAPPPSYGNTRSQYGNGMANGQYNKPMRPTAVGRPPAGATIRCGDCGNVFTTATARFCPQCGSRR